MKNHKNILMSITAGILSCSFCMTASAGTFSDADVLKRGLLMESGIKLTDYNTNQDDKVNVLDLCRIKRDAIEESMPKKQYVSLNAVAPWISSDKSTVTVPVKIKGNKLGVSAVSFTVEYNTWYFELTEVYTSAKDSVTFSKNNDRVQYTAGNNENNTIEGYLIYLVFEASPEVPLEKHTVELTDIEYAMIDNGAARELQSDECSAKAKVSFEFSRSEASQTPVTEPFISTTTENTTTVKTTTTAKITTAETTKITTASTSPATEKSEILNFRLDNAELSSDSKNLRIPVYMDMNTGKVGSFSSVVKYDTGKFKLVGVERGDFDGYGYVGGNSDNAVFAMNNGQNISQRSGIIAYLKFEVNGGTDSKTYSFELSDIKSSYYENWNLCQIDKLQNKSETYRYTFSGNTSVTEPPVTAVTTVKTQPATTTVTTRKTEPSVTTVTTKKTNPVTTTVPNVTNPPAATTTITESVDAEDIEREIADLINKDRESNSMKSLTMNAGLCKAADKRAQELAVSWSLDRPNGESLYSLYNECGVNVKDQAYVYVAQATTASGVMSVVNQTKMSNFDNRNFNSIGVGHAYVPESPDGHYWVVFVATV